MDLSHLVVQLFIAIVCGLIGNMLIPRRIPGKFAGLIVVGFAGVWLGEWGYQLLKRQYGLDWPLLHWSIQSVPIIPAIVGSMIVIYILTTFLRWGHYSQ